MPVEITEDWLDILDTTNYAPLKDPDNTYQSYRFKNLDISSVTTKNFRKKLCPSLIEQVEIFIPPSGSFSNADLRRYLVLVPLGWIGSTHLYEYVTDRITIECSFKK